MFKKKLFSDRDNSHHKGSKMLVNLFWNVISVHLTNNPLYYLH